MKKIISTCIISLASAFIPTLSCADPITHNVDYICPAANELANFGGYIGGFGYEILSASTTSYIYFQSRQLGSSVPGFLGNYDNFSTNYDGPSGTVTCSYSSSAPDESNFSISYSITNGKGGRILSKSNKTIRVLFLVGSQAY